MVDVQLEGDGETEWNLCWGWTIVLGLLQWHLHLWIQRRRTKKHFLPIARPGGPITSPPAAAATPAITPPFNDSLTVTCIPASLAKADSTAIKSSTSIMLKTKDTLAGFPGSRNHLFTPSNFLNPFSVLFLDRPPMEWNRHKTGCPRYDSKSTKGMWWTHSRSDKSNPCVLLWERSE